jgi:hypothetical protein
MTPREEHLRRLSTCNRNGAAILAATRVVHTTHDALWIGDAAREVLAELRDLEVDPEFESVRLSIVHAVESAEALALDIAVRLSGARA